MSLSCRLFKFVVLLESQKEKETQDLDLKNVTTSPQKVIKVKAVKNHIKGTVDLRSCIKTVQMSLHCFEIID